MILALDIGGTKLAAAAVDNDGSLASRAQVTTPAGDDPEVMWGAVVSLLEAVPGAFDGIGVGCGGPMTRGGDAVSPLNIPAWREFPLRSRLAAWSALPVEVDNDAKAFALGEWWRGALRGGQSVMGMVVSTGVGGGLIIDGRMVDGIDGNAGHIGHVIVAPEGRACPCGSRGCLEAEISGRALAAVSGGPPPFPADLVARAGRLLGLALVSAAALCDLEAVAIGGGVATAAGEALLEPARQVLSERFRIFGRSCDVRPGVTDPLIGAAAVMLSKHGGL